jgi:hypothetical protein
MKAVAPGAAASDALSPLQRELLVALRWAGASARRVPAAALAEPMGRRTMKGTGPALAGLRRLGLVHAHAVLVDDRPEYELTAAGAELAERLAA